MIIILTLATFLLGTLGFKHFEHSPQDDREVKYGDSFYWTFTTVTTVGYGDYYPVTIEGRVLYYVVALLGISVIGLIIGELGSRLVEVSLVKMKGLKKTKIKDHIIIVGWNPTSRVTHDELIQRGQHCIVIDESRDFIEMKEKGISLVSGNAMDTRVLEKASIGTAKAIILPILNDEGNVMISLKAKKLNNNIKVIAAVNSQENLDVASSAGVSVPIPSSRMNGLLLANAVDERRVVDFIVDVCQESMGLDISQHIVDKKIKIGNIPLESHQKIIVVYRKGKPMLNFTPGTVISKGDWALSLNHLRE